MQPIENIMKLRKGYAIKLYEYFNHAQPKLEERIAVIRAESDGIYQEENAIWFKLQEKKITLEKFEREIETLSESKGVLDKKRLVEVKGLREKLELKYAETESEYQLFLDTIAKTQEEWEVEVKKILLDGAARQKILIKLHQAVTNTFPDLKEYCSTWKDDPINRLKKVIKESENIEKSCISILSEIKSLSSLNMDQQHLANTKTNQIPKSCESLSKYLESFITNLDYLDILEKTKDTDPFVGEFFEIFKDTGFTSLRTSIRMVNNISTTEKKLVTISEKFQLIQLVFKQVLDKLYLKKTELMEVCTDADIFAGITCDKWLTTQYKPVLKITEQINQKRNEFVVNDTII